MFFINDPGDMNQGTDTRFAWKDMFSIRTSTAPQIYYIVDTLNRKCSHSSKA